MKRVGLVSFMHESNSLNPDLTTLEMFKDAGLRFGKDILSEWSGSHHEISGMIDQAPKSGLEIVPLVSAWEVPGGPVQERAYEEIVGEILKRIAGSSLDGLLLSLHGAMVTEHIRDADGETAERIRQTVGPVMPIVMTLDLHANVSERMVANVTATTIYRTYPHVDQRERGREATQMLNDILKGRTRPIQALEKPPMLISLLAQRTAAEPMAALYRHLEELIRQPGVISGSIAPGFPYADVEEMGPAFLVVADGDAKHARQGAQALAKVAWDMREKWNLTGTPVSEAVTEAARTEKIPVTLLDVGDNVGGGSPGDSTIIFEEIVRAGVRNALVVLYDPGAVQACVAARVGNTVSLEVGGKSDDRHGRPISIQGRVRLVHDGLFVEREPRHGGKMWNNQGLTAVVETEEEHTIVLTSLRMVPFSLEQLLSLGIKPGSKRALIVKGAVAPRAAYEPVSARVIEVDTHGITNANPTHFKYRYRHKPMFPFEPEAEYSPSPSSSSAGAEADQRAERNDSCTSHGGLLRSR